MSTTPTDAVAFYSDVASSFHESYKGDPNRRDRLTVWSGFFDRYTPGASVAYDLGCGSGIFACELARRGMETVGIDGAAGMLEIGRKSARDANLPNVTFQQHRLPIRDTAPFKAADFIMSSSALEYLDSMPEALRSIRNMMKPGGTLVFSVSNRDSLSRKAVRLVHGLTGRPAYFGLLKQFMTVEQLKADLAATGFTYLEHAYFAGADRLNSVIGKILPQRFATNMIIVAARLNR